MERSSLGKWLGVIALAILLGFLAGRQQQILNHNLEILRQLGELRASLPGKTSGRTDSAHPPGADSNMKIQDAATRGNIGARVTMIEFSDFECPYCGRYTQESYPQLDRDYIGPGKIQYVFRHYPLTNSHPHAMKASEAGECARRQDRFWPLHDRLFANQKALEPDSLLRYARAAGLEMSAFETCLGGQAAKIVQADLDAGNLAGVEATPTFFFGFTQTDGSVKIVDKVVGARPYGQLQAALEKLLAVKTEAGRPMSQP